MKTSVEHSIEDRWDLTGDDGTSRFSLVLLRIVTAAFFISAIGFLVIVSGLIDSASLSIRLQSLVIVSGVVLGIMCIPLGFAIGTHPIAKLPHKFLWGVAVFGYFATHAYYNNLFNLQDLLLSSGVMPWLFLPGLLYVVLCLAFIPITRAAWMMRL